MRIHRIGQLAPQVRVRKFIINDSVEERIVALQGRKKAMAGTVYSQHHATEGGSAASSSRLSVEEFKLLFDTSTTMTNKGKGS